MKARGCLAEKQFFPSGKNENYFPFKGDCSERINNNKIDIRGSRFKGNETFCTESVISNRWKNRRCLTHWPSPIKLA